MDTPSLRDLHGEFWRAIGTAPGTLAASDAMLRWTASSPALDAAARLRVYTDAYFWRLRDVLREDFPRLAAVLGDEAFEALARDYLRAHPSVEPSVRHLGDRLPGYLDGRTDLAPYLADLARLERARTDAFDAPDAAPVTVDQLRDVPADAWAALRLEPVPALCVLRLAWPVMPLWSDAAAVPAAPAQTVMRVWRGTDFRIFHAVLEPRAAALLERLRAGAPFGAACAAFDDLAPEEGARQATALLARWLADGLIARISRA